MHMLKVSQWPLLVYSIGDKNQGEVGFDNEITRREVTGRGTCIDLKACVHVEIEGEKERHGVERLLKKKIRSHHL